tara:strand:- start:2297 stop:3091 length:795 start_codon:yes stop_codon:yes gene_type:complete
MFDIYIINLESEIDQYHKLFNILNQNNFTNINRYNAILGKNVNDYHNYKKDVTFNGFYFLPYGALGGALSHYNVLKMAFKLSKYKYTLILEDDAIPLCNYKDICKILETLNDDFDIIILNSFEIYKNIPNKLERKTKFRADPATAYIVNHKSIPKILSKPTPYYFDVITFNRYSELKIYITPNLFTTSFKSSHNLNINKFNDPVYKFIKIICEKIQISNYAFFLLFKAFRLPYTNIEPNGINLIYFLFLIFIIFIIIFITKRLI